MTQMPRLGKASLRPVQVILKEGSTWLMNLQDKC